MTGHEAWSIIAPVLTANQGLWSREGDGLNAMGEAYIVAYQALSEYDENRKGKTDDKNKNVQGD